jgi:RNA polymerase sigma factor (TIGR02999 family)
VEAARPDLTLLLRQLRSGDSDVLERVAEVIYPDLRRVARQKFRHERPGHPLQATALVHETYLRLISHEDQNWKNRASFFAAAAEIMRRILVDHARIRGARKRDGDRVSLPLTESATAIEAPSDDLLDLDQALSELHAIAPRQARIVELRYFVGLSIPEIARLMALSPRAVDRDWAAARSWLRRRLRPS